MQALLSYDIHFLPQQGANLIKKISQIQQTPVWSQFDQEIDIALLIFRAASNRPKYTKPFHPILSGNPKDLGTF